MKFRTRKTKEHGEKCGAQLRNKPGRYCQKPPMVGKTRCKIHGGATPSGIASPHYKNGIYSAYLPAFILEKIDLLDQTDPLNLLPELGILRGLLATYLHTLQEKEELNYATEITIISDLIARISTTVNNIVKIRNDTALTVGELKLVAAKIAEISSKYITDDQTRSAYLSEIFTTALPGNTEARSTD